MSPDEGKAAGSGATLATAEIGRAVKIARIRLADESSSGWLAAVGIAPGEECVVLRRASLGGPLHVRLVSGGEFAVAREIAEQLDVTKAGE